MTRARWLVPLLLVAGALRADDLELLRRAVQAESRQPRVGRQRIEVYPTATALVSEVAVAFDGSGRARREHLSGPSRGLVAITEAGFEWLRAPGSEVWQRVLATRHGDVGIAEAELRLLGQNYRLTRSTGGPVAGRATVRLDLVAKQPGNPSRRLWLDAGCGLTLKAEIRNHAGELAQRWEYTQVVLRAPDPASVRLPAGARKQTAAVPDSLEQVGTLAELERRLGHQVLQAAYLPPGYRVRGWFVRACRNGGWTPVTCYSDGLNPITLMETRGRGPGRGRRWRGGRCQIQPSRLQVVVRIGTDGHEAVIVGDADRAELEALARSLR